MEVNKLKTTKDVLNKIYENLEKEINHNKGIAINRSELNNDESEVQNLLEYYKIFELINVGSDRKKYDGDAVFFNSIFDESSECLRGDILVSFWTPYSTRLGKEKIRGLWLNKFKRYTKNYSNIKKLMERKGECEIKSINEKFECIARAYWSRGNLLLLPDRKMNNEKYINYEDRLDMVLKECFKNGDLAGYFKNDNELKDWIKKEHLVCMFDKEFFALNIESILQGKYEEKNELIKKTNVVNLLAQCPDNNICKKRFKDMEEVEIDNYINNMAKVIAYRNTRKFDDEVMNFE